MAASTSGLGIAISDPSSEAAAASRSRRREFARCHLAASFTTLLNRYALRSSMPDHRRLLTQPRTAAETTSGASEGPIRPVANLVRSSACFRYSSSSPTPTPIQSRNRAFWVTRSWVQAAISEPRPRTPHREGAVCRLTAWPVPDLRDTGEPELGWLWTFLMSSSGKSTVMDTLRRYDMAGCPYRRPGAIARLTRRYLTPPPSLV